MKNFKLFLLAITLFAGTNTITAQELVAHINTQELVDAMPEMKSAQAQLEKLQKTYDNDIKSQAKELDAKIKQYDAEASTKTEEENLKRVEEVQGMQNNIAAFRQNALQDLEKKQVDVFQPIIEKARVAIQKVARAQGIKYVLDSAIGNGVILADGKDLLADVKKELGI